MRKGICSSGPSAALSRRRVAATMAFLAAVLAAQFCKNNIPTEQYLKAQGLDSRLSLSETSVIMQVNATRTFTIIGGKPPFSVKVLGSGTAGISGNTLTYTAGSLIDNVSLNVTDAQNFVATIAIDVQGVATQPTDIGGAALWLKADSLNLADNAGVTTWPDSSGNARDFSGGGGAVFRTNFVNGNPAISFNGTSHYLARAFDANINTSTMTLFVLHYPENVTPATAGPPIQSRQGTTLGGYFFYVLNNSIASANVGGNGSPNWIALSNQGALSANNWYLFEMRLDSTFFSFSQNAQLQGQLSMVSAAFVVNASRPTWIAAGPTDNASPSFYYTGKIAEIIYFNRALTASEVQGVRCYLKNKYALSFGC